MLRGFDVGLLTALAVALVHGIAWSIAGLTFGLLAVAVGGGWLIGYAIKQGVAGQRARALAAAASDADRAATAVDPYASAPYQPPPRGMSTMAALLALMTYIVGSFVAFAIVQLQVGEGALLDRLTPANFGAFMNALIDPPLLQSAVLAAYVVIAWLSARPSLPRQARNRR